MRVFATCLVALGLIASPAIAGTGNAGDKDSAGSTASSAPAATTNAAAATEPAPSSLELANQLQQLRDLIDSQSKQIERQNELLQEQQHRMRELEDQLNASGGTVAAAANAAVGPSVGAANATLSGGGAQDKNGAPDAIHVKGITLTPGGFFAAETVWRQKGLASDVNTPFNSVPFNGSSNSHMGEFQASGRQSRISMLAEGKLDNVKLSGYYEADFLTVGTTSTPTQSNSYGLRQRQFWAQAAFNNGITFTGGQMWSLVTETTKGMDNRTEALPMTIDAQYNVGFSWARQFGARLTYNMSNKVWLGFSVEQSTPTVTVHGNPTAQAAEAPVICTTPGLNGCGATGTLTINLNPTLNNFLLGAFGTSGGLYNPLGNYGYNEAPDFVVKAVFEPGFGHYEIFGIAGVVRDRIFPCVTNAAAAACIAANAANPATAAVGAFNDTATTGGAGANARWNLLDKKVDVGIHFLGGAGIGRYGSGTLSDLTIRPNGTVVPIHNFQGLGTLQFHPTSKLDIYMNVGGEFEERTAYLKTGAAPLFSCVEKTPGTLCNEGYGGAGLSNAGCWTETLPISAPSTSTNLGVPTGVGGSTGFIPGALSNCTGDTRNLVEGTLGFWYRFYSGPKGRFQYGMQYSNFIRNTWRGVAGTGAAASGMPHADENMILTSFRYYLP